MKLNVKIVSCFALMIGLLQAYPLIASSQEEDAAVVAEAVVDMEQNEEAVEVVEAVEETLTGVIESIDVQEQMIVVQYEVDAEQGVMETAIFRFSEELKVMKNGQEVPSSDLKAGDKVTLQYNIDEEGNSVVNTLLLEN